MTVWYDQGTVTVTLNSANVVGSSVVRFQDNVMVGDMFIGPDDREYQVINIPSQTQLTIKPAYSSATGSARPYRIAPIDGHAMDAAKKLTDLINKYASAATLAENAVPSNLLPSSNSDVTPGRILLSGMWGLGVNNGYAGDPVIQNNSVNGFYRSGTGSGNGKPVNNSSDSYIKMGWSGAYATYLYASPSADKFWFQNINNGVVLSWKEIMTMGVGGIGLSGAGATTGDIFPGSDLSTLNVGAGIYYFNSTIGSASGLPFGSNASDISGQVVHRQSGTAGGQIVVTGSGKLAIRGRVSGNWGAFSEVLRAGDYGFGGAQSAPPNGRASSNPTGWYYAAGAAPSFGGGSFFLDLAYNTTAINSGLRISTTPYTDDFFMNGAVSGQRTYRPACKLLHDKNMVGDVATGAVVGSGSNSNGRWTRFADGTQICYGNQEFPGNGWVGKAWQYPLAFVGLPIVTASGIGNNDGFGASPILEAGLTSVIFRAATGSAENKQWANFGCIAIGRWKA